MKQKEKKNARAMGVKNIDWDEILRENLFSEVTAVFGDSSCWKNTRPVDIKKYKDWCRDKHIEILKSQGKDTPTGVEYGGAVANQIAWAATKQKNIKGNQTKTWIKVMAAALKSGFIKETPDLIQC
jgi:hypothetical protein